MVIESLIKKSNKLLRGAGIENHTADTYALLCSFLNVDKLYLLLNKKAVVPNCNGFFEMVERRAKHEPIAYITEKCGFMSLDFYVNPAVLIPRPETEVLVESIIDYIGDKRLSLLEIGAGSGCISISLEHYCKNLSVDGVDISSGALDVAKKNARLWGQDKINFTCQDIFKSFPKRQYDIIVSNPPYIKSGDLTELAKDVKDYEPLLALDGGDDGLSFYHTIIKNANAKRMLAFEVGHDQAESICALLRANGYKNISQIKDLAGINRVLLAYR